MIYDYDEDDATKHIRDIYRYSVHETTKAKKKEK